MSTIKREEAEEEQGASGRGRTTRVSWQQRKMFLEREGSNRGVKGHEDVETATGLSIKGSMVSSQRARLKRCWRPKSGYSSGRG